VPNTCASPLVPLRDVNLWVNRSSGIEVLGEVKRCEGVSVPEGVSGGPRHPSAFQKGGVDTTMWRRKRKHTTDEKMRLALASLALFGVLLMVVRHLSTSGTGRTPAVEKLSERKRIQCFVGVQTGFPKPNANHKYDYQSRRSALRNTWFPDERERERLESEHQIVVRFVIGHSQVPEDEARLEEEANRHRDMMRLPITEHYLGLPKKTITFFKTVLDMFDPEYIFKVDDDVYLKLSALSLAIPQWRENESGYVGCMKNGQIFKTPNLRWFEPQHRLMGNMDSYFTHAWGPAYVVSRRAAADIANMREGSLRFFNNEDVTVGAWMLALNVVHDDDRRLCDKSCKDTTIAMYDMPTCSGLCNATYSLPVLHSDPACRDPADPTVFQRVRPLYTFKGVT